MGVGVSYERGTPVLSLGRARLGGYQARLGAMGQSYSWKAISLMHCYSWLRKIEPRGVFFDPKAV